MKKNKILIPVLTISGLGATIAPLVAMTSCSCGGDPTTTIKEIKIDTLPSVNDYKIGQKWDYTGLKVKVIHNDGKEEIIDKDQCTISPVEGSQITKSNSETPITVSYKQKNVVFKRNVTVEIIPLQFKANENFKFYAGTKNWDGDLEYSIDGENFTTWDGSEIQTTNNSIWLRSGNTPNTTFCADVATNFKIKNESLSLRVECDGDIRSLLNCKDVSNATMANGCFSGLFMRCHQLIKAPALPATELSNYCYDSMFDGCSLLEEVPELPATTLKEGCYQCMFLDCKSLVKIPTLPATTLEKYCYYRMFEGTNLFIYEDSAPSVAKKSGKIFATPTGELPEESVTNMFRNTSGTFNSGTPTSGHTYYWYDELGDGVETTVEEVETIQKQLLNEDDKSNCVVTGEKTTINASQELETATIWQKIDEKHYCWGDSSNPNYIRKNDDKFQIYDSSTGWQDFPEQYTGYQIDPTLREAVSLIKKVFNGIKESFSNGEYQAEWTDTESGNTKHISRMKFTKIDGVIRLSKFSDLSQDARYNFYARDYGTTTIENFPPE